MTSCIWHMDYKGSIQFWIKTADRVWQTSLTEELKISQFLPREMRQTGAEMTIVCDNDCMEHGG